MKLNRPITRGRPSVLNNDNKKKIVDLWNAGRNSRQIAEAVKVSRRTVLRFLRTQEVEA